VVIVDTAVWVEVFRDASGVRRDALREALGDEPAALTRFHELEMLQGCRDEKEWGLLKSYLETQDYLEMRDWSWQDAARTYFDLRRMGRTVRSPIDCCIAQVALDHDALLLHRDRDFEVIAEIRPLRQARLHWR
jgi:predicted nucleic acid-binding protein